MSIFDNPNLLKSCRAIGDILDCLSGKDELHKREIKLMHETLRKDFTGSYGQFLNTMDVNRTAPLEAEKLRKVQQEIEILKQKLEEELQQQRRITQSMTSSNSGNLPQTNNVQELQRQLQEMTQKLQGMSSTPTLSANSLETPKQETKSDDFFKKMYGK